MSYDFIYMWDLRKEQRKKDLKNRLLNSENMLALLIRDPGSRTYDSAINFFLGNY